LFLSYILSKFTNTYKEYKNYLHVSLFSSYTMAYATRKHPLLPSNSITDNKTLSYGPFKWHPSMPIKGLWLFTNPVLR
jgi:hypothetical protein